MSKVVNTVKESPNELVKFELMRLNASGAPEVKVVEGASERWSEEATARWASSSRQTRV